MTPCRTYFRPDGSLLITAGDQTVELHLDRQQAADLAAVLIRYAQPRRPAAALFRPTETFDDDQFRIR